MSVTAVRKLCIAIVFVALVAAGCGDEDPDMTLSQQIPSCESGAVDVIAFLQRTLDDIGEADAAAISAYRERFDLGVDGLLQRAQEMHCTEAGFNNAVIARAGDLEPNGPFGEELIDRVAEVGLGSLDASRGGPLTLPNG